MVSASGTLVRGSGRSLLFLFVGMLALGIGAGATLGIASVFANNHTDGTIYYACVDPRSGTISHLQANTPPNCPFGRQLIALSGADATAALSVRVAALETLLACVQHEPGVNAEIDDIVFSGCNVHVRNGEGATATTNELGNLIIGYNEERAGGDDRGGSHNLVVGPEHTYSSYGGFVAGFRNSIANENASVSGGRFNQASGPWSSVSGGQSNRATELSSSVSGGFNNTASGAVSSVSGGDSNTASGLSSSVSGGSVNVASGFDSSVSGGFNNTASGGSSSVSGGESNTASGEDSSVSGGGGNTAFGTTSSVSGGFSNTASGLLSSVSGGEVNTTSGPYSSVSGGQGNTAGGTRSSVSGGANRTAPNPFNWAAGGLSEAN